MKKDKYYELVLPVCQEIRGEPYQNNCSAYLLTCCTASYMREQEVESVEVARSVANYINQKCKEVGMSSFMDMKVFEEAVHKICERAGIELDHTFPFSEVTFLSNSAFIGLEELLGLFSRRTRINETEYGYVVGHMSQEDDNLYDVDFIQFGYLSKSDLERIKARDFHAELLENCYGFRELLEKLRLEEKVKGGFDCETVKL